MKKASAFTLIELLVVISIIAVLAGIALPVFSKVLERGKATNDASNLKQLGVGVAAFLADNDDQMFAETPDASGGGATTWPQILQSKYVSNWKVFRSPFDKRPDPATPPFPVSYGINQSVFGVNASKYASPSQLITMAAVTTGSGTGAEVQFTGDSGTNVRLNTPQGGGGANQGTHFNRSQINALFADSHVESLPYRRFADTTSEDGLRTWFPLGRQQ